MRKLLMIGLVSLALPAFAQISSKGFNYEGPKSNKAQEDAKELERIRAERAAKAEALKDPSNYRVVNGQIYNAALAKSWIELHVIEVFDVSSDGLVCDAWVDKSLNRTRIFLAHHPEQGKAVYGKGLNQELAMPIGRKEIGGSMLAAYDCGVVTNLPATRPTPDQQAAATKAALDKATKQKEATFKHYEALAAKGDALGQFKLGEFYLRGDWVGTNVAKAKELFTLSAAQGNAEAKASLDRLSATSLQR